MVDFGQLVSFANISTLKFAISDFAVRYFQKLNPLSHGPIQTCTTNGTFSTSVIPYTYKEWDFFN